jgi:hypothetical protein
MSTSQPGAYETLVQYSMGQLSRASAMERLRIDHYRDLLGLLGAADLPTPTVSDGVRAEMVTAMLSVLQEAGVPISPRRGPDVST